MIYSGMLMATTPRLHAQEGSRYWEFRDVAFEDVVLDNTIIYLIL